MGTSGNWVFISIVIQSSNWIGFSLFLRKTGKTVTLVQSINVQEWLALSLRNLYWLGFQTTLVAFTIIKIKWHSLGLSSNKNVRLFSDLWSHVFFFLSLLGLHVQTWKQNIYKYCTALKILVVKVNLISCQYCRIASWECVTLWK